MTKCTLGGTVPEPGFTRFSPLDAIDISWRLDIRQTWRNSFRALRPGSWVDELLVSAAVSWWWVLGLLGLKNPR